MVRWWKLDGNGFTSCLWYPVLFQFLVFVYLSTLLLLLLLLSFRWFDRIKIWHLQSTTQNRLLISSVRQLLYWMVSCFKISCLKRQKRKKKIGWQLKDIAAGWDTTCCGSLKGGIWWDKTHSQKVNNLLHCYKSYIYISIILILYHYI